MGDNRQITSLYRSVFFRYLYDECDTCWRIIFPALLVVAFLFYGILCISHYDLCLTLYWERRRVEILLRRSIVSTPNQYNHG